MTKSDRATEGQTETETEGEKEEEGGRQSTGKTVTLPGKVCGKPPNSDDEAKTSISRQNKTERCYNTGNSGDAMRYNTGSNVTSHNRQEQ